MGQNKNKLVSQPPETPAWHRRDEVKRLDRLDAVREARMAERWQKHKDREARDALVRVYMYLAVQVARLYRGYTGVEHEDLVEEGYLALLEAIDTFDPQKSRLSTYGALKIRSAVQEYVMRNWSVVKVMGGDKQRVCFFNLSKVAHELGVTEKFTHEEAERAAALLSERFVKARGMTADDILFFEHLRGRDLSLNAPAGGEESEENTTEKQDMLASDTPTAEEVLIENTPDPRLTLVEEALERLSPRARDIITRHRLAEEEMRLTLKDLAKKYRISIERVRQVERNALREVCQFLDIPFKDDLKKK